MRHNTQFLVITLGVLTSQILGESVMAEPCTPLECNSRHHQIYVAANTSSLSPGFSTPDLDLGVPLASRFCYFGGIRRAVDEFGRIAFSARLLDNQFSQNHAGIWTSALPDPMPCQSPLPVFIRVARSGMPPPGAEFQEWTWDTVSLSEMNEVGSVPLFARNNYVVFAARMLHLEQGLVKTGLWLRKPTGVGYSVEKVFVDGDSAPSASGDGSRVFSAFYPSSIAVDAFGRVVFVAWTEDSTLDTSVRYTSQRLGLYLYDPAVTQIQRIAEEGEQLLTLGVVHRLHIHGVSQSPAGKISFTADVNPGPNEHRRGVFLVSYEDEVVGIHKVVLGGDLIPGLSEEFLNVLGIDTPLDSGAVANNGAVSVNDLGEVVFVGSTGSVAPGVSHLMRFSESTLTSLLRVGDAVPWRNDSRVIGSIAAPVISNPVASETSGQISFVCEEHEPIGGDSYAYAADTVAVWYPHPVGIFNSGFIKVISMGDSVPAQSAWGIQSNWSILLFHDLFSIKVNDSGQVVFSVTLQQAAEDPPGPTTRAIYVWDPRLGYPYCVLRQGWTPSLARWTCNPGVIITGYTTKLPRFSVTADRSMGVPTTGVPYSSWIALASVEFIAPNNCTDECYWSAILLIRFVAGCNAADIARSDGYPEPDNQLDNGDFTLFVTSYFVGCTEPLEVPCGRADICGTDGSGPPDGQVDNGDFTLFLAAFFSGC
jgi:hypothetical protein